MATMSHDYRRISLRRLHEVSPHVIIDFMNNPDVRRHLALDRGHFSIREHQHFVLTKERIWEENGYGPWAFLLDDNFVGWDGLQPEGEDVDVALALHKVYWGAGRFLSL